MAKIIVHHLLGRYPFAGIAYQTLHHLIGFSRLGHDVYYVEDSDAPPYNPTIGNVTSDHSYSVNFVKKAMEKFGFAKKWAYYSKYYNVCYGLKKDELAKLYKDADAIVNLCGTTLLSEEHMQCPVRMYIETDPVTEQIKIANGDTEAAEYIKAHTHKFTYGENLGNPDCPIPLPKGVKYYKTRPPVVLDLWKSDFNLNASNFTSLCTWKTDKKGLVFKGNKYMWDKRANFFKFQDLPKLVDQKFELATGKEAAELLNKKGWKIVSAVEKSKTLDIYKKYIHNSRGEFTVAKDNVVKSKSGWFSDRSVCYLAAGKPVVLQETGFSKFIPTGKGLFSFKNMQEAAAAIKEINKNYEFHCKEARKIAEKYFDSDKILKKMLDYCGI